MSHFVNFIVEILNSKNLYTLLWRCACSTSYRNAKAFLSRYGFYYSFNSLLNFDGRCYFYLKCFTTHLILGESTRQNHQRLLSYNLWWEGTLRIECVVLRSLSRTRSEQMVSFWINPRLNYNLCTPSTDADQRSQRKALIHSMKFVTSNCKKVC